MLYAVLPATSPHDAGLPGCLDPGEAGEPYHPWVRVEEEHHLADEHGRRVGVVYATPLDIVHNLFAGGSKTRMVSYRLHGARHQDCHRSSS